MESTNHKRLQALKESGTDRIFEAYQWFQQHRHELNKEAYGPVLLEVLSAKPHPQAHNCVFVYHVMTYPHCIYLDLYIRLMFQISYMLPI